MDKKTKLIVIILGILTIIGGLFAFQINNEKQALIKRYTREINELSERNERLTQQAAQSEQDRKRIQSALDSAKRDLDNIASERKEWKKKYDLISKEKDQLLEKISILSQELAKKPGAIARAKPAPEAAGRLAVAEEEAYWSHIIKEKAGLELRLDYLNEDLTNIKLEFEQTRRENHDLELALSKLEQIRDDLQRQLEYNEKLANNLSSDLAREVNDKQFLLEQFNKIKRENSSLRTQIKELATTKLALEKGLVKLRDEKDTLDKRIFETEQVLGNRIDDILELKEDLENARVGDLDIIGSTLNSVQLPPIIVRTQAGMASRAGVPKGIKEKLGRIVSINEGNNFVVIDLGENSGIQMKDRFNVYRGLKQIATIEVIQLRRDIAAADIVKKQGKIEVGDLVK